MLPKSFCLFLSCSNWSGSPPSSNLIATKSLLESDIHLLQFRGQFARPIMSGRFISPDSTKRATSVRTRSSRWHQLHHADYVRPTRTTSGRIRSGHKYRSHWPPLRPAGKGWTWRASSTRRLRHLWAYFVATYQSGFDYHSLSPVLRPTRRVEPDRWSVSHNYL